MEEPVHKRSQFRDPFGRDPPPKAFYHPSRQKQLKKKDKKIALSPRRNDKKSSLRLTPGEEAFLKGTNTYAVRNTNKDRSDDSEQFEESWPNSERPSYSSVPDSESHDTGIHHSMLDALSYLKSTHHTEMPSALTARSMSKQDSPVKGSVLQSYIERFRHGAPMSREERQRADICGKSGEFWWLSQNPPAPSDTSTPKDEDQPRSRKFTDQGRHGTIPLTTKTLQEFSNTMVDEDTRKLQARADRLLEESLGSLRSSEPAVSSDGLGSTSCTTGSSVEEVPYRPVFTRYPTSTRVDPIPESRGPDVKVVRRPQKPEDDILYQWRLRRKMEVAQTDQGQGFKAMRSYTPKETESKLDGFRRRMETVTHGIPSSSLHFTPTPQKLHGMKVDAEVQTQKSSEGSVTTNYECESKDTCTETSSDSTTKDCSNTKPVKLPSSPPRHRSGKPEIASPTLSRKKESRTEPHLHLMCDLLPCPHAEEFSRKYSNDQSETFSDSSTPEGVRYKQYLQAEKPQSEEKSRRKISADDPNTRNIDKRGNKDERGKSRKREEFDMVDARHEENSRNDTDNFHERKRVSWNKTEYDSTSNSDLVCNGEPATRDLEKPKGDNSRCRGERSSKGRQLQTEEKHQTAPKPVYSSSPGRPTVSLAIGQTISEHLFSGSTSAILSSVDSWASIADQSQLPSIPVDQSNAPSTNVHESNSPSIPVDQSKSLINQEVPSRDQSHPPTIKSSARSSRPENIVPQHEEDCDSDGEFPDDHILKMLRQQRAEYEIKLRQIDDLLQQSSFGQQ